LSAEFLSFGVAGEVAVKRENGSGFGKKGEEEKRKSKRTAEEDE
jgi:hypothetical protein